MKAMDYATSRKVAAVLAKMSVRPGAFSTGPDLHIDNYLTNLAINYRPQNFIADMIAPIVPVDKESNLYPVFNRMEAFGANHDTTRARGQEAKKITRSVGSANYKVKNYALGSDIAIEDRANMDEVFRMQLDVGATQFLLYMLGLDYEKRVLTLANASASVSTTFVPSSAWGVQGTTSGDPVSTIFQMIEYVQGTTGQKPNSIGFGWKAWNYFRRNTAVRNFLRGLNNGGGVVTREMTAALFEVDKFWVSEALWHTQNEAYSSTTNAASMSLTNPIADSVIVYYAPPTPSMFDPSWMYSFRWSNPVLPSALTVERHPYDSRKKVETIEAGYWQDERITGADYAVKLSGVNSAQANGLL